MNEEMRKQLVSLVTASCCGVLDSIWCSKCIYTGRRPDGLLLIRLTVLLQMTIEGFHVCVSVEWCYVYVSAGWCVLYVSVGLCYVYVSVGVTPRITTHPRGLRVINHKIGELTSNRVLWWCHLRISKPIHYFKTIKLEKISFTPTQEG